LRRFEAEGGERVRIVRALDDQAEPLANSDPRNRSNFPSALDLRWISILEMGARREFAIDAILAPNRHPPIK
jgi:hypothetical protein